MGDDMPQFSRRVIVGGLAALTALGPTNALSQSAQVPFDLPSILARMLVGWYRYVPIAVDRNLRILEHIAFAEWVVPNRVYVETYIRRNRRDTIISRIDDDGSIEVNNENGLLRGRFSADGLMSWEGVYSDRQWTGNAYYLDDGRQRTTAFRNGRQLILETERVSQEEALRIAARLFPAEYSQSRRSPDTRDHRTRPSALVRRLALVIGAGHYESLPNLRNPPNDARAIATRLTALGYQVETLIDPRRDTMINSLASYRSLSRDSRPVDIFFYAGHAVEIRGRNFLLPVDIPTRVSELESQAVGLDFIMGQLPSARHSTRIIILDACRDGPAQWPGMGRGLAQLSAPQETYVAYSTAPGMVAVDGHRQNSPFTLALANELAHPREPIEAIFRNVRRSVAEDTNGRQIPWDSSSLTESFYFSDR